MAKIPLTHDLFPNKPVLWMEDVGPVVIAGSFAFCCECEAGQEQSDIFVWIYEKPETLPEDVSKTIPKTRTIGKRAFEDEKSMLHMRNFILKFVKDKEYRKEFLVAS